VAGKRSAKSYFTMSHLARRRLLLKEQEKLEEQNIQQSLENLQVRMDRANEANNMGKLAKQIKGSQFQQRAEECQARKVTLLETADHHNFQGYVLKGKQY